MAYTRTNWIARVGTALNRFLKTNETSTEVELTNDPTGVTTAGTPFTVDNMNKIEQGIYDAHVGLDNNGLIDNTRINQDVRTTASPAFANATIAGHNIDSELDTLNGRVNQGVKTTDSPTFASIDTGFGYAEAHPITYQFAPTPVSGEIYIPPMAIGEIKFYHAWGGPSSLAIGFGTPDEGYGTYYVYANTGEQGMVKATSSKEIIANVTGHYSAVIIRVA